MSRLTRTVGCGVVVAAFVAGSLAAALAREPAFHDAFWDVSFDAESFVQRPRAGGAGQLVTGAIGDAIAVEVQILEGDSEKDAAACTKELLDRWKSEGRKLAAQAGPDAQGVLLFTDLGLGGALRRHAYQVRPRGVHGFVMHALGKPGDDTALRGALAGLAVGERRVASLGAAAAARASAIDPDDPRLTVQAVEQYLPREKPRPAVAAQIVTSAMLAAPPGTYTADDLWSACESVGVGFLTLRENASAVAWLRRARERAGATTDRERSLAQSLYNLACAHAVSGDKDAAFATLDELVKAGLWQGNAEWAQEDADLAALRADDRWARLPTPADE